MTNLGIASDVSNTNFAGASDPDAVLHVKFYMRSVLQSYESEKQGRPIYMEVPYVQIMSPGNQLSIIDTPVRDHHKVRFPKHWAAFENSQHTEYVSGTPVEEWPAVSRSQAEEMKGLKFFSVEQVAGASDEQIQRLGMNAQMLRQKARAFLENAKNSALAQQQASEIQKRDQQIADLSQTVTRLSERLEQLLVKPDSAVMTEPKPKRQYTKRSEQKGPDA